VARSERLRPHDQIHSHKFHEPTFKNAKWRSDTGIGINYSSTNELLLKLCFTDQDRLFVIISLYDRNTVNNLMVKFRKEIVASSDTSAHAQV
jgi:hypothetical protein